MSHLLLLLADGNGNDDVLIATTVAAILQFVNSAVNLSYFKIFFIIALKSYYK
ncbi:MAG TPA: hypothetical protein VKA87_08020 [Nitrososphaeraceae archaeon]|nr:hypothetical protein [Nitrososphaeraceae archaeon]